MQKDLRVIFGIDEVGRGPLAGPVMAVAITIIKTQPCRHSEGAERPENLNEINSRDSSPSAQNDRREAFFNSKKDSKKLTARQRETIYNFLKKSPDVQWGIGKVSEKIIDKINILQATKLAMVRAVLALEKKIGKQADMLLIDGNFRIGLNRPQQSIIKGDEKVFLISLASIVAKVERDNLMIKLHKKYPQYGFAQHKGYGTPQHLSALSKFGPCPLHRTSFKIKIHP